jgi:hypothetical protein
LKNDNSQQFSLVSSKEYLSIKEMVYHCSLSDFSSHVRK